jgi:hypothetical protein
MKSNPCKGPEYVKSQDRASHLRPPGPHWGAVLNPNEDEQCSVCSATSDEGLPEQAARGSNTVSRGALWAAEDRSGSEEGSSPFTGPHKGKPWTQGT